MPSFHDRRRPASGNPGGPGIREENFADYAAGRLASLVHQFGYAATALDDALGSGDGACVFRRTGLDAGPLPLSLPINAAKSGNAMARVYSLTTDATAGNRSLTVSLYGENQFGNPIREEVTFSNVAPSTAPAAISGSRIFMRVSGCVVTARTNIAPGDRFSIFASVNINPAFGLPIRILSGTTLTTNPLEIGDAHDILGAMLVGTTILGPPSWGINLVQQGAVLFQVNPAEQSLRFFRGSAGGTLVDPYNLGLRDEIGGLLNIICRSTRSTGRLSKRGTTTYVKSW